MDNKHIIKGFGALSNEEVNDIEFKLDVVLPEDYKKFLINYNGGLPRENYLITYIEEIKEEIILGVLLGKNDNTNFDLISWNLEYKCDMPKGTLIIGIEYGSGMYVMFTDDENRGIYFWDHAYIFESTSDEKNIYFLNETFTDFINSLHLDTGE